MFLGGAMGRGGMSVNRVGQLGVGPGCQFENRGQRPNGSIKVSLASEATTASVQ
tara:strand:- start:502 stop:663 length:162 start_codon:yes stop_codon:yes gene_type:complete